MKKNKLIVVTIAYLLVTLIIILSVLPNALSSLSTMQFPKPGKYSPVLREAMVEAELLYRNAQIENTVTPGNYYDVNSESKPYLSLDETLALYQPATTATNSTDLLDIPEDCEISTNLAYEKTLFNLINEEREKRGLSLLVWSDKLSVAARKHSIDMACNRFFSHTNLRGEHFDERISAEGYQFYAVGENLYAGDNAFNTPQQSFSAWFYSTRHFKVMTHPVLSEVGIGYIYSPDSPYGGYFTADFGTPE